MSEAVGESVGCIPGCHRLRRHPSGANFTKLTLYFNFLHCNVQVKKCKKVDFTKKKLHQCNNVSFAKFAPGDLFESQGGDGDGWGGRVGSYIYCRQGSKNCIGDS